MESSPAALKRSMLRPRHVCSHRLYSLHHHSTSRRNKSFKRVIITSTRQDKRMGQGIKSGNQMNDTLDKSCCRVSMVFGAVCTGGSPYHHSA